MSNIFRIFFSFRFVFCNMIRFAQSNGRPKQRPFFTVFESLFAQWALVPLCYPHVMSFSTTIVLLRHHFALHSEAITMQTGIVLMLSSFYCHHQNVTTLLTLPFLFRLLLLSLSLSLSLVHFVRHSCHSILSNAIYKELILTFCVRKFFSVLFSALCKNVHKSSLYGFLLGYRVLSLVLILVFFVQFSKWEMTSTTKVSLHSTVCTLRTLWRTRKLNEMK